MLLYSKYLQLLNKLLYYKNMQYQLKVKPLSKLQVKVETMKVKGKVEGHDKSMVMYLIECNNNQWKINQHLLDLHWILVTYLISLVDPFVNTIKICFSLHFNFLAFQLASTLFFNTCTISTVLGLTSCYHVKTFESW